MSKFPRSLSGVACAFASSTADLDRRLAENEFVSGERFTVADITAFVTVDFATRAIKEPAPEAAINLKRWRETIASRPSARI
jgi:glutathione S-transferase